ncbi:hypothetical protein T4B_11733 [Trichinella pseudospiralis]|uniref:Uncharacterized protein n=1 Tax=Trichinella pseudospiralis TaxID=6337 RepID=A0A0V1GKY3_TRIPS|nr:hypothetical protein T4B_11733 [Trichinella pseudospiralis]
MNRRNACSVKSGLKVPLAQPHKIITQKKSFLPLLICFSSTFRP